MSTPYSSSRSQPPRDCPAEDVLSPEDARFHSCDAQVKSTGSCELLSLLEHTQLNRVTADEAQLAHLLTHDVLHLLAFPGFLGITRRIGQIDLDELVVLRQIFDRNKDAVALAP